MPYLASGKKKFVGLAYVVLIVFLAACSVPSSLSGSKETGDSRGGAAKVGSTGSETANDISHSKAQGSTNSDGEVSGNAEQQGVSVEEGSNQSRSADATDGSQDLQEQPVAVPTYAPGAIIMPTPTPVGHKSVRIVTFLGETNVMSPIDGPALVGVLAEVERINASGGVLGHKIDVDRYDTESRLSVVASLTPTIIATQPDLIITSCDTNFSKPILEAAQAASIPTISPCANDPAFLSGSYGSANFTLGLPSEALGAAAAKETLTRLGSHSLILRDVTSPEALAFCDGFEAEFVKLGGVVSYSDQFNYDTPAPLQDRLTQRRLQGDIDQAAIVLCSHVPGGLDAAPTVISILRNLGLKGPIVSGPALDSAAWFAGVPDLGDLMLVTWSSTFGNDPDQRINEAILIAARHSDPQTDSDVDIGATTVLGSDAVAIWADALRLAQSLERPQVISSLGSLVEHRVSTGNITFAGGQRMDVTRKVRLLWVSDGFLDVLGVLDIDAHN